MFSTQKDAHDKIAARMLDRYADSTHSAVFEAPPAPITDTVFKEIFVDNFSLARASHNEESFSQYCFDHLEALLGVVCHQAYHYFALRSNHTAIQNLHTDIACRTIASTNLLKDQMTSVRDQLQNDIACSEYEIHAIELAINDLDARKGKLLEEINFCAKLGTSHLNDNNEQQVNVEILSDVDKLKDELAKANKSLKQAETEIADLEKQAAEERLRLTNQLMILEAARSTIQPQECVGKEQEIGLLKHKMAELKHQQQEINHRYYEKYKALNAVLNETGLLYPYEKVCGMDAGEEEMWLVPTKMMIRLKKKWKVESEQHEPEQHEKEINAITAELKKMSPLDAHELEVVALTQLISQAKEKFLDDLFKLKKRRFKLLDRYVQIVQQIKLRESSLDVKPDFDGYPFFEKDAYIISSHLDRYLKEKQKFESLVRELDKIKIIQQQKLSVSRKQLLTIQSNKASIEQIITQYQNVIDQANSATLLFQIKKNAEHLNLICDILMNFQYDKWSDSIRSVNPLKNWPLPGRPLAEAAR